LFIKVGRLFCHPKNICVFVIYCYLYILQNVVKSEDKFPDVIALLDSLSMFGCEILCY